jgi:hypothetical protein
VSRQAIVINITVSMTSPLMGASSEKDFALSADSEAEARALRPEAVRRVDEFIARTVKEWVGELEMTGKVSQ